MSNNTAKPGNKSNKEETVQVLYQKMGDRWFAFSMVDDEVFIGSITQEEIDTAEKAKAAGDSNRKTYKISGNS